MGNQKFILYLKHNYSTLDKEVLPFYVDPKEGSLTITHEKEVLPFWRNETFILYLEHKNSMRRKFCIFLGNQKLILFLEESTLP